MQKPLILLLHWFGPWPEWIDLFVESCKWNRDIDWLIFTDQEPAGERSAQCRAMQRRASKSTRRGSATRSASIRADRALQALRPEAGLRPGLRSRDRGLRNYGHCDLDLIFGNIRAFYTDAVLDEYEVISTHADRLSGHLAVLRNNAVQPAGLPPHPQLATRRSLSRDLCRHRRVPLRQRFHPPLALAPPDRAARAGALRGALTRRR